MNNCYSTSFHVLDIKGEGLHLPPSYDLLRLGLYNIESKHSGTGNCMARLSIEIDGRIHSVIEQRQTFNSYHTPDINLVEYAVFLSAFGPDEQGDATAEGNEVVRCSEVVISIELLDV